MSRAFGPPRATFAGVLPCTAPMYDDPSPPSLAIPAPDPRPLELAPTGPAASVRASEGGASSSSSSPSYGCRRSPEGGDPTLDDRRKLLERVIPSRDGVPVSPSAPRPLTPKRLFRFLPPPLSPPAPKMLSLPASDLPSSPPGDVLKKLELKPCTGEVGPPGGWADDADAPPMPAGLASKDVLRPSSRLLRRFGVVDVPVPAMPTDRSSWGEPSGDEPSCACLVAEGE